MSSKTHTKEAQRRSLTPEERQEIEEMTRAAAHYRYVGAMVKKNTLLFPKVRTFFGMRPRGAQLAREFETLGKLLEGEKNLFVSDKLAECGWAGQKVSLDLKTGKIELA